MMMDIRKLFVDEDEKAAAVLGERYLENFLENGTPRMGFCIATDRRIYLWGKYYYKSGKSYKESKDERIIDIKDVVGSSFTTARFPKEYLGNVLFVAVWTLMTEAALLLFDFFTSSHFGIKLISLFCLAQLAVGLLASPVYYFYKRHKVFEIEYTGGKIAFLHFFYHRDEMEAFQKGMHRAKDT